MSLRRTYEHTMCHRLHMNRVKFRHHDETAQHVVKLRLVKISVMTGEITNT